MIFALGFCANQSPYNIYYVNLTPPIIESVKYFSGYTTYFVIISGPIIALGRTVDIHGM